jgi:hypothetical protein
MTCSTDSSLYEQAESLEYVPIQRLMPMFDAELVQRVCALCDCSSTDDMGMMIGRLDIEMEQSWMNEQSAQVRQKAIAARK